MKTAVWCTAALVLLTARQSHGQTVLAHPAPTTGQCRADATVWSKSTWSNVPVSRLWEMNDELDLCVRLPAADHAQDDLLRYAEVQQAIAFEYLRRMQVFLDRHHLYRQFESEDQAGVR